jgi:hypothetical protein
VSAKSIFEAFNACRQWLLPALEDVTEDDLLNELLLGRAQLWAGDKAAVVTQCTNNPPCFHLWLAGGPLADVMSLLPGGVAWARSMGLKQVTVDGRKGWSRVLKAYGFEGDDMLVRAI